jgi:hypothetical protein
MARNGKKWQEMARNGKKWQEMKQAVKRRLHVLFEVTVRLL